VNEPEGATQAPFDQGPSGAFLTPYRPAAPADPVEFMAAYLSAKAAAARAAAGVSAALHEEAQAALEDELSLLEPRVSSARVSSGSARFSSGGMVRPDSATPRAAAVSALVKGAVEAVLARPSNAGPFTAAPEAAEEEQPEAPAAQEDEVLME
jgi:hypothetical protein